MSTAFKGVALITGASTGIGATYADRLARRGYELILVARDAYRLATLAQGIRQQSGVGVETLPADLTDRSALKQVEKRLKSDQRISLLVNNAGVAVMGSLIGADIDRIDSMIQLNVVAATRLAAAALPGFVERRNGTLINIGSVVALAPERISGSYSGTKAYLLNFTQNIQNEVADTGVRVQAVLPGATRTEIWERAGANVDEIPAERLMDVDELVDAALAGLDQGELVTIPSLPEVADWQAYNDARLKFGPNLSRNRPASRYKLAAA